MILGYHRLYTTLAGYIESRGVGAFDYCRVCGRTPTALLGKDPAPTDLPTLTINWRIWLCDGDMASIARDARQLRQEINMEFYR